MSPDELQALIDDATFDHATGDEAAAVAKLEKAAALRADSGLRGEIDRELAPLTA